MSKKIKKGVIAAAGKGTRFLPVTKAIPKEMLPVIDKPIIQYIVEEFVEAGIEEIVIVTSWDHRAIEDHFDHSKELEDYLSESGKEEQLERVKRIADMANFIYVRQKGPYGNGTPCLNSEAIIGDEPFIYAFGDDLVLAEKSFTKSLVEEYEKKPGIYFGVQEVPEKEVVRYGIAQLKEDGEPNEVEHFVEKPSVDQAPSNLAGFGRYVLEPGIFEALKGIPRGKDGELWLVDAVEYLLKEGHKAYVKKIEDGRWYTTGDPVRYFEALRVFALNHLEYGSQVKHIFK